jgi:hypothetical protein
MAATITDALVAAVGPGTILGVLAISVGIIIAIVIRITAIIATGETETYANA